MAGEKPAGNQPANQGSGNSNKGPNRNNRRRSLRSKRRGRKPEESSEPREARIQPSAPKPVEKSVRDNRERRRRRRMRAKQRGPGETPAPAVEDTLKDLPPLVPAFVYTHVLRPAMRDSFEFRTEHFSKVTRKLEDFHIDLSPLYPDGGDEIKGVAYMPPTTERSDFSDEDDDSYDEGDWDDGEYPEASLEANPDEPLLEGVIADDFYDEMDDTAPGDEDLDAEDSL
jgi:hypothetical protein